VESGAAPREAILFVVPGAPLTQVMAVPTFRQLARSGGVGLMTTAVPGPDQEQSGIFTMGAGSKVGSDTPSDAGSLAQALRAGGGDLCVAATSVDPLLELGGGHGGRISATAECDTGGAPRTIVERIGRHRPTDQAPASFAGDVVRVLGALPPDEPTLVLVAAPYPSPSMVRAGDETTALIVAEGKPSELLRSNGSFAGLTSDTTRYRGLVANVDVAPTILDWFGVPIPSTMDGLPIRVEGSAPFGLYERERGYRHVRFLVQVAEGAFVTAAGLLVFAVLWLHYRRGGLSPAWRRAMRYFALSGATLPAALLTGGLVPSYSYVVVAVWMVAILALFPLLAMRVGRGMRGPFPAYRCIGAAGLVLFAIDAIFGFHAMRVPLLGGVMFDGVRFYGIPNAALAPLLASAVMVAAGWRTWPGIGLLFVAGLFAGLPWLGADVGGATTLFFAAGLWWSLRTRRTVGLREAVVIAVTTVVGVGIVLAASRYAPGSATHATRFVERSTGVGSIVSSAFDRLGIGVRQLVHFPEALAPLIGLPVLTWYAVRRRGPFVEAFGDERLRHVMLVLAAGAVVGYFANDTGLTAASPLFVYGMTLALYAVCSEGARERVRV
jgi:hypothetical protein